MKAHIMREKPTDVSDTKLGTWAKDWRREIYRNLQNMTNKEP